MIGQRRGEKTSLINSQQQQSPITMILLGSNFGARCGERITPRSNDNLCNKQAKKK
jgi:hypothetical protein